MGLLDGLLGNVLGGMSGNAGAQQNPLIEAALDLLRRNGGLEGLLGKFQQSGFGAEADSWVSTGQNMPISGDVLQQVLGSGALGQIASQLGMSQRDATGGLAGMLPDLVDRMTPQGQVPDNSSDLVEQALALLTKSKMG